MSDRYYSGIKFKNFFILTLPDKIIKIKLYVHLHGESITNKYSCAIN